MNCPNCGRHIYEPNTITNAGKRMIAAIMNDLPRSSYQADIDIIEDEARQLLVDIVDAARR